jgi:uncharacterized protein
MIEIKNSEVSGRGVFASVDIPEGALFHQAPVITYPNEEHQYVEKTVFADYTFEYGIGRSAILLGYGMLFNHSYDPNATYEINFDNETFDFFAFKDIKAGEEVFINYNGDVDDTDPLWFNEDYEETKED